MGVSRDSPYKHRGAASIEPRHSSRRSESQVEGSIGLVGAPPKASAGRAINPVASALSLAAIPPKPIGPAPRVDAATSGALTDSEPEPSSLSRSMNSSPY